MFIRVFGDAKVLTVTHPTLKLYVTVFADVRVAYTVHRDMIDFNIVLRFSRPVLCSKGGTIELLYTYCRQNLKSRIYRTTVDIVPKIRPVMTAYIQQALQGSDLHCLFAVDLFQS